MNLVPLFEEALEFQDYNGSVLSNGKAAVYYIGRTRLADIYNDVAAEYPAENPRILDNLGMGPVYVSPAFDYELVVFDEYNNELFSVKKYLASKGEHSTANVVVTPSESIAVSAWTVGDVQVYMPYITGQLGKVYTGIEPVNVDNVNDTISVSHVGLGLQEPLYFVEDSETACIIGCSAQTEIPSATSGKWEDAADTVMDNSAQWGEDTTYEAGSYVDITDNTISITGLQPAGDYADRTALGTKLDTTAFSDVSGSFLQSSDLEGYATESFVNSAVDSAVSGKLDSATYANQSGDFYLTSNPAGYITNVPTSYLQNTDLTIVDNKITEISGIELSAGDEFPQSATEAIEVVTANSGDWNNVSAKLDKADSANFYTTANESGFATTSQLQTVSGEITGLIPTDLFTKASADTLYQPIGNYQTAGDYLTTGDSANFYTTANESGFATTSQLSEKLDTTAFSTVSGNFLTAHQELPESANWNSTYNTVHDNSASWTGGAATLPISGSAGDNSAVYGLYDMKIEYNLPSIGGSEPEHTYTQIDTDSVTVYGSYDGDQSYAEVSINPSYIEFYDPIAGYVDIYASDVTNWNSTYNTVHDNSASWTGGGGASYTGDAQGALDEVYSNSANWNETYSAVSSNSADWNTVIDVSAGSGIVFNKVNNVVYIEADIRTGSI